MAVDFQTVLSSPSDAYAEGLEFFRGKGMLNNALKRLVADLDKNGIDYVIIGAIALNHHGYRRFTEDIDLLLTKEGLEEFHEKLIGLENIVRPLPGHGKDFGPQMKMFPSMLLHPVNIGVTGSPNPFNFQTLTRLPS